MLSLALKGYEEVCGPDHITTLDAVQNRGLVYWDQGKLDEAEVMILRALKGYEKVWGPDHSATLDAVHNLGLLYHDQGRLDESEKTFLRADSQER
jgi:tetratricopeptide (TPR) repeat protein